MKKYFLSVALLMVAFAFSCGQSADTGKRVENLAKRKFQWMIDKRVDSLEMALDDGLKYIHSNGSIQSKSDVLNDLKNGKLTYASIDARDLEVRVYDRTAIVTGKGKFTGNNNGAAFAIDLLFTEVYVYKDKSWKLASRHANRLP